MRKSLILTLITTAITTVGYGQSSIGIDIYNRYVWRGTDLGNAAALQLNLEFKKGNLTIGAWSSWAVNSGSANENDIHVSAKFKSFTLTVIDYFFPGYEGEDKLFDHSEKAGSQFVEASYGPLSVGAGNGMYTIEGKDEKDSFQIINVGFTASRDQFTATYVINPQQETSFFVFGDTF